MATVELGIERFEQTVQREGIVLVDFWAAWCGPCRMFAPVFEAASESHDDIVFANVDTEAEQELASAAGISSIPTLMAFRDGVLIHSQPGALAAPPSSTRSSRRCASWTWPTCSGRSRCARPLHRPAERLSG
jgi:thioredoxin 1